MPNTVINIPTESLTLILNGHVINDFIEGDHVDLTPLNPLTDRLNGAGDSFTVTDRVDNNVYDMVFRVVRFSDNDVTLNGFFNRKPIVIFAGSMSQDYYRSNISVTSEIPPSAGPQEIEGDENSGTSLENWTLEGGTFIAQPTHKKNNQTQEISIEYTIQFRNARRLI